MNKYFDQTDVFSSNSRIYEGFFTEEKKEESKLEKACKKLLSIPSLLSKIAADQKVRGIAKAGFTALSLIALVGIAGAIEAGTLGLGSGLLCGALLLGLELLCRKGRQPE